MSKKKHHRHRHRPHEREAPPQHQRRLGKSQNLRVIPLGGLGEVGRNMTVVEYRGSILIVDVGLRFPEEDMPGIDCLIPNIEYLKGREKDIEGVVITHGHLDHIGAIPYLIEKLRYPTIYTTPLTAAIIKKRQTDFKNLKPLDIEIITCDSRLDLGPFRIEAVHINHSIPDSIAVAVTTPAGTIFLTGDFKLDPDPMLGKPADFDKMEAIARRGVLALFADSTNADVPGRSITDQEIYANLEKIITNAPGRVIAATFASLINRAQQIIAISEKHGRRVLLQGYGMKTNMEIARELGYVKFGRGTLIEQKELGKLPPNRITILGTGAQGEEKAMLMRIASGEHRIISIQKNDTVIFSSSVIPGNERAVQAVKDLLARQGARIFHYRMMDIHASGHGQQEDLKQMISLVRPRYLVPIHGNYYMLKVHGELGVAMGIPEKNIALVDNGSAVEFAGDGKMLILKEKAPAEPVMVDGLGVGDIREVVLRDRKTLASDGMVVVIVLIDSQSRKIRGEPDIITRGFVHVKESQRLIADTKRKVHQIMTGAEGALRAANWGYVRDNLRDRLGQYLFSKIERRPMILPVVIEV